jgi:hypothetical protein
MRDGGIVSAVLRGQVGRFGALIFCSKANGSTLDGLRRRQSNLGLDAALRGLSRIAG